MYSIKESSVRKHISIRYSRDVTGPAVLKTGFPGASETSVRPSREREQPGGSPSIRVWCRISAGFDQKQRMSAPGCGAALALTSCKYCCTVSTAGPGADAWRSYAAPWHSCAPLLLITPLNTRTAKHHIFKYILHHFKAPICIVKSIYTIITK